MVNIPCLAHRASWSILSSCLLVVVIALTVSLAAATRGKHHPKPNFNASEVEFAFDYGDALSKCLLFFENQRSGKLPNSQRATWRGDSGLSDGNDVGVGLNLANDQSDCPACPSGPLQSGFCYLLVDLTGGYYDAGDNVKFGLPMAYTATLLAWGVIEYGHELNFAGQLEYAEEALRWITDYLLKAVTGPTELWVQVGDAKADHACWERPEDMDTSRKSSKIDEYSPGTEPAGETAAALAAAAKVFKDSDSDYSAKLREKAYADELIWAAAWLYEATDYDYFLNYAVDHIYLSTPVNTFSWDNKYAGAQVLLSKHFLRGYGALYLYKAHADAFVCAILPSSPQRDVDFTPGGLMFIQDDNNIQYVTTSAFLLAVYSDFLTLYTTKVYCHEAYFEPSSLYSLAKSQVDYILGSNPLGMSYMVGFSDYYPKQSHHRGASIVSLQEDPHQITCLEGYSDWYYKDQPNPNTHTGAILGPNRLDQFWDNRTDFVHLETPTYVNAPFVGLLAKVMNVHGEEN